MPDYANLRRWTRPQYYFGASWPEYYSSGVGQSRDSDALERSNFASMLKALGGESESVIVVRENHFLVGWVEWIAIHQDDDRALTIADGIMERLADYPVVDESDWSERETEDANQTWANCFDWRERIEYIRDHRHQFDFRDFSGLRSCVRGEYFAGYASELIG